MTKEDLEERYEDCFSSSTRSSEGGYGPDVTDGIKLWKLLDPIISSYAKQQAIAFAIHYAKSAILNGYVKPSAVDGDRMEERYTHFIDNQFIEQQNKP